MSQNKKYRRYSYSSKQEDVYPNIVKGATWFLLAGFAVGLFIIILVLGFIAILFAK